MNRLKTWLIIGLTALAGCYLQAPEVGPRPQVKVIYIYESAPSSWYDYRYNAYWQYTNPLYRPQRFTFEGAMNNRIHRRPEPVPAPRVAPPVESYKHHPMKKPDA